jgi:hypothetical protein
MPNRPFPHWALVCSLAGAAALALGASCSASGATTTRGAGSSGTGAGGQNGATGTGGEGGGIIHTGGPYSDFPAAPVVADPTLPPDIGALFQGATGTDTGGPCLTEPAIDAMVPRNWTPLLFEWTPGPNQNVFELRLAVKNQIHDLVVYTGQPSFTIDGAMWKSLAMNSAGEDITVTIRGAELAGGMLMSGPFTGATGAIHLAPVDAPGSVVYWTSTSGTSFQGFTIGDAKAVTVLTPALAGMTSTGGPTDCISCHASSPDGKLVVYTRDTPNTATRAIDIRKIDGSGPPDPKDVSPAALALLGRDKQSAPVLSKAHYAANDAVVISVFVDPTLTQSRYELIWTDLHAADQNGWGILQRTGDPNQVASPSWRHDGTAVAYVSSTTTGEGVVANGPAMDIYTVPYNDRMGGAATPLPGASDPGYREFYPVYSPGDTLLAFNRTDQPVNSYNQPSAELLVVPAEGGAALRLAANDPPACAGLASPGLTNSWARWAPSATAVQGKKYYWLVFSSKRRPSALPQLYISAIVTTVNGGAETIEKDYPALYVTSQDPGQSNHTPAWDVFEVNTIPQ